VHFFQACYMFHQSQPHNNITLITCGKEYKLWSCSLLTVSILLLLPVS
jgi:hypothetical protein